MGLGVGVHDRLEEPLVLFAAPVQRADQWLAAAHDGGLGLGVDPRQHLEGRAPVRAPVKGCGTERGELQLELQLEPWD